MPTCTSSMCIYGYMTQHAHVYACIHIHAYFHTYRPSCTPGTCTHGNIYIYVGMCIHIHVYTDSQVFPTWFIHTHVHRYAYRHRHIQRPTCTSNTCTKVQTHTHIHESVHIHMNRHISIHVYARTQNRVQASCAKLSLNSTSPQRPSPGQQTHGVCWPSFMHSSHAN